MTPPSPAVRTLVADRLNTSASPNPGAYPAVGEDAAFEDPGQIALQGLGLGHARPDQGKALVEDRMPAVDRRKTGIRCRGYDHVVPPITVSGPLPMPTASPRSRPRMPQPRRGRVRRPKATPSRW